MMTYISKVLLKYKLMKICANKKLSPAGKAIKIENSLKRSRCLKLRQIMIDHPLDVESAINSIMSIKSITLDDHPRFQPCMKVILTQISGYRELEDELDAVRRVHYDSHNPEHETALLEIWKLLKPNEALRSRVTKQWTEIGFQGDDPMTDFRGMGILGLQNLHYLCSSHTQKAQQLLSHSHHPRFGYSFAIVGINITSLALQLMRCGALKTHFYNAVHGTPKIVHFHHVYVYLMTEFDKFWFDEEPRDIMEFNRVLEKYKKNLLTRLKSKDAMLGSRFATYM